MSSGIVPSTTAASVVGELSRGWQPRFGALDAPAAARARTLVSRAREDLDLVITHNRTLGRATDALERGALRASGRHRDGLERVAAIAPDEDAGGILFATPQFVERGRPLDANRPRSSRPAGEVYTDSFVAGRLGLSFGDATFVLDDALLHRATALPGQWHETLEHLPGVTAAPGSRLDDVLVMRLAHDAGAWRDLEATDPIWRTNGRAGELERYPLAGVLDLPEARAVDAVRGWLLGIDRTGMITELHVRDVTPRDVRLLLVEGMGAASATDDAIAGLRELGRGWNVPVRVASPLD